MMDPALTAEEWREGEVDVAVGLVWLDTVHRPTASDGWMSGEVEGTPLPWLKITWRSAQEEYFIGRRHAVAALALYGQPFGFTREDVEAVESAYDVLFDHNVGPVSPTMARLWSLRDRIAALLPPPESPA